MVFCLFTTISRCVVVPGLGLLLLLFSVVVVIVVVVCARACVFVSVCVRVLLFLLLFRFFNLKKNMVYCCFDVFHCHKLLF